MPSYPHDAIIIVFDIGKSVSTLHPGEKKTFFEHSKGCVSWIIQRKLISQSEDVLALVLIGSDDSTNSLSMSGYKNICCKFDLNLASWEMLKFIECEVKTTENVSDWIGALIVSMEMLKVYEEFNSVKNKKIVFFSDFTCPSSDNLEIIIKNIKALKIDITIIGPDNFVDITEKMEDPAIKRKKKNYEKSKERQKGEELVHKFWQKLPEQIVHCTFEAALKQLCSYTRKSCRRTPWNCIMDIGNVKINISLLKKTDPKTSKKFNMKYIKLSETDNEISSTGSSRMISSTPSCDSAVPVIRDKVMHFKHETATGEEIDVEITKEDTIEGYRYGASVIPFSEEDKAIMEYKPGPKCFSVIGFTKISSVPFYLLSGDCSYIVVPGDKDENAAIALSALIQAMKKKEFLAIVRKVYSDNRGLSLGILYPFIEEIVGGEDDDENPEDETFYKECLIFIELAFEEEVKSIYFPPLENFVSNISEEQYRAVDNLIETMDLMEADSGLRGESNEAFDLPNLHDVKEQFFHYCVIQRGLHPDRKLPKSLPSYINKFVKVPESVENKSKPVIENLKKLFNIIKQNPPENSSSETTESDRSAMNLDSQGSQNHFSDSFLSDEKDAFKRSVMKIFVRGFPSNDEFKTVLVEGNEKKDLERIKALKTFVEVFVKIRNQYLNKNPDFFNCWMYKFKAITKETNAFGTQIWDDIVSKNLGLISKKENKFSSVTADDEENFLYGDLTQSPEYFTPKYRKPDFEPIPEDLSQLLTEAMETDFPV